MKIRLIKRMRLWSRLLIAASLVTIVSMEYIRPWAIGFLYQDEYKRLAWACDNAMHNEVAIRSSNIGTDQNDLLQTSADVELLVCHDYDKLRKKMLTAGISEDQLALYGLESLEAESVPVSRMVDPHRMPRF